MWGTLHCLYNLFTIKWSARLPVEPVEPVLPVVQVEPIVPVVLELSKIRATENVLLKLLIFALLKGERQQVLVERFVLLGIKVSSYQQFKNLLKRFYYLRMEEHCWSEQELELEYKVILKKCYDLMFKIREHHERGIYRKKFVKFVREFYPEMKIKDEVSFWKRDEMRNKKMIKVDNEWEELLKQLEGNDMFTKLVSNYRLNFKKDRELLKLKWELSELDHELEYSIKYELPVADLNNRRCDILYKLKIIDFLWNKEIALENSSFQSMFINYDSFLPIFEEFKNYIIKKKWRDFNTVVNTKFEYKDGKFYGVVNKYKLDYYLDLVDEPKVIYKFDEFSKEDRKKFVLNTKDRDELLACINFYSKEKIDTIIAHINDIYFCNIVEDKSLVCVDFNNNMLLEYIKMDELYTNYSFEKLNELIYECILTEPEYYITVIEEIGNNFILNLGKDSMERIERETIKRFINHSFNKKKDIEINENNVKNITIQHLKNKIDLYIDIIKEKYKGDTDKYLGQLNLVEEISKLVQEERVFESVDNSVWSLYKLVISYINKEITNDINNKESLYYARESYKKLSQVSSWIEILEFVNEHEELWSELSYDPELFQEKEEDKDDKDKEDKDKEDKDDDDDKEDKDDDDDKEDKDDDNDKEDKDDDNDKEDKDDDNDINNQIIIQMNIKIIIKMKNKSIKKRRIIKRITIKI